MDLTAWPEFYYDRDTEKFREIDYLAYRTIAEARKQSPSYPLHMTVWLIIECKKRTNSAWVFFPKPRPPADVDYGSYGLECVDKFQAAKIASFRTLFSVQARDLQCLAATEKSLSYDVVKLIKVRKCVDRNFERKQIYDALTGLAKCLDQTVDNQRAIVEAALETEPLQERFYRIRAVGFRKRGSMSSRLSHVRKAVCCRQRTVVLGP